MYDNKTDATITGGMMDSKSAPINPMQIYSEDEVTQKNVDFKNFEKALRFGTPKLCDMLVNIYKNHGLDGLNTLHKLMVNLYHINRIITGEMEVDFEDYPTKEQVIVAILTGEIEIDWEAIYNGTDGWIDEADSNFNPDFNA